MKTNVTLKLDADLLREVRVMAAEEGRSISALLTDRLEAIVRERKAFDKARRGHSPGSARASTCNGLRPSRATSSMSDKYFVDTNILMYAHDNAAGAKHERAKALVEELWRDRTGVVSTQVLQELAVNLGRTAGRPLDVKATREVVADYLTWQVIANNGESILDALDLETRYQLSFWNARVVQAAQASGAEVLYSEDLSSGQRFGPVRVVNPLT
jgi:predicted nucleic acid-binding protein